MSVTLIATGFGDGGGEAGRPDARAAALPGPPQSPPEPLAAAEPQGGARGAIEVPAFLRRRQRSPGL